MGLFPLVVYLALCLLVGWRGIYTRLGFWGTTFMSLLLTPVVMFIALILFQSRNENANPNNISRR
jgi:hypothetical protein